MIVLKSDAELNKLYAANQIVARTLRLLSEKIEPGMTTAALDALAEQTIRAEGAEPAFKGYHGFPSALCISINEQVVHGIPGKRRIKNGDVVSLDVGVLLDGFYGDAALTVPVGDIAPAARKLLRVTEESLYKGIEKAVPGGRLADISAAVQQHVEDHGFSVVRDFVGHGIGRSLHEDPQIPNFYSPAAFNPRLKAGMVLALEPMVNQGTHKVRVLHDGWTAVTQDGKLSAHYEHTVAVTAEGPWILSRLDGR
ncbi:MAG: type I methionyl aminopeptidase [Deltaproteobacteria bacterium]|nr:type I methionyl aminopeptidase [Deltaproteobacteria bacterium]